MRATTLRVAAHRKLEGEYSQLDTLEGRQAELETLRVAEGRRAADAEREVKELEKALYAQSQSLFKERSREKDLISTISGGQAQNRNMVAKIQQLDDQARVPTRAQFVLKQPELRAAFFRSPCSPRSY